MSSVDDLVISLTIKEGGNISKLQKQLTALVGTTGKGMGVGFMYLKKGQDFMRRDLKYVKTKIAWLLPTETPSRREPESQVLMAKNLQRFLKSDTRKYAEKLLPTSTEDYRKLAKSFGIDPDEPEAREKVLEKLGENIRGWIITLEDVIKGAFGGEPAPFLEMIKHLTSTVELEKGERLTLRTNIQKTLKENQTLFIDILEKYGVTGIPEVYGARLKDYDEFFKSLINKQGELEVDVEELLDNIGIKSEENREIFKSLWEDALKSNEGSGVAIKNLLEKLKIDISHGELWSATSKLKLNESLKVLFGLLIPAMYREKGEVGRGIPLAGQRTLIKAVGKVGKLRDFFEAKRIDFLVTNIDKAGEAVKIIGEDAVKRFEVNKYLWIEFENELSKVIDQHIRDYEDIFGLEELLVLGQLKNETFLSTLKEMVGHVKIISLPLEAVKMGIKSPLMEEEGMKLLREAEERLFEKERVGETMEFMSALLNVEKQIRRGEELSSELREFTKKRILTHSDFLGAWKELRKDLSNYDKTNKEIKDLMDKVLAFETTGAKENPYFKKI